MSDDVFKKLLKKESVSEEELQLVAKQMEVATALFGKRLTPSSFLKEFEDKCPKCGDKDYYVSEPRTCSKCYTKF